MIKEFLIGNWGVLVPILISIVALIIAYHNHRAGKREKKDEKKKNLEKEWQNWKEQ